MSDRTYATPRVMQVVDTVMFEENLTDDQLLLVFEVAYQAAAIGYTDGWSAAQVRETARKRLERNREDHGVSDNVGGYIPTTDEVRAAWTQAFSLEAKIGGRDVEWHPLERAAEFAAWLRLFEAQAAVKALRKAYNDLSTDEGVEELSYLDHEIGRIEATGRL